MKFAFSTLGCPDWSWSEVLSTAKDLEYDGIEFRGLEHQLHVPKALPFLKENILKTKKRLEDLHLEIPCLTSSCYLFDKENIDQHIQNAKEYIDTASLLNIPYIRVLGDLNPDIGDEIDINFVKKNLLQLANYAKDHNVTLLLETNGVFADSQIMKKTMEDLNHSNIAVLWDIHHPYRFMNEEFSTTYTLLKPWIQYIHVKDSIIENDAVAYKIIGAGDIPIGELIHLLYNGGYTGYLSLEWVKRWNKNLENPGIVFPHYITQMRNFVSACTEQQKSNPNLWEITMGDLLDRMAADYPDHEAIAYGDQDYRLTYSEFKEECNRIAKGFLAMGIKKGDHVAVWATNYPQWIISQFATAKIGAVLVTVNTNYKIFEAEYLLRQSDSTTLILMDGLKDTNYANILYKLCPELETSEPGKLKSKKLPYLKNVIYLDKQNKPGMYQWDELYTLGKNISDKELYEIQNSLDVHEVINMQYTSGTTGFPKGVMLTHYNIVNNGKNIGDCMHFTPKDRLCIPVPFFHCFGCVLGILASVTHGTTMVPVDHYNPLVVMKAIENEGCTAVHGVPTMFIAMLDHPDFDQYDFSTLRTGIMAGSPCPEKVMREVINKMNMKEITIAYGQTEAAPVCTQTKADDSIELRVATVGKALPYVECKIVDPETGEDLPFNQQGEFVARGYNIMKGYYKMPEATSEAIDKDQWLHTGDLATMDKNGYFKITGRIKDMIIRGGENIYPKEIEEFLYTHEQILDVQIVGVPDKQYGEVVGAFIVLKEGAQITEEKIKEYVLQNMARHKVPKNVFFVSEFPMTASGKIQKFKLRDMAVELLKLDEEDIDTTV